MKNTNLNAVIFGIAIVIAAYLLGNSIINRNKPQGNIAVTGLGKADFTSDLIVWEGSFSKENPNLKEGYNNLEKDKKIITDYLMSKGIKPEELIFKAVKSNKNTRTKYSPEGKYMGEEFLGYRLTQSIKVESNNVEKVEKISREITELLNKGIQFYSQPPRYYYTKLADLKVEMISKATADARSRAEKIAENSGESLGDLISAKMGIFQITGQNSNENYSWGGTYNTSSKEKTASITMKLNFEVN
ncbi:SIMPL domain-containing protein [Tenacibaculum sp. S7007]|uniref:SIMPL domain-containing protein n=1 Tax=Tenacibaculum pelagium TaxID=2759527 RepID=A0A839ARW0_9FLAO|nr:SIMPL domain-containing protein [Tenacibaculum pelagium]MBA6157216.1 SIMPL domain-containing protein [Tenacibaculum pelagium]